MVVAFGVGLAIGALVAWVVVSALYYEALRKRGLIDATGQWVKRR